MTATGEWIKCSERMPEAYTPVLAWDAEAEQYRVLALTDYGAWFDRHLLDVGDVDVTHWTPILDPPT